MTTGYSAAGSACTRLPPMVPRVRMGRWPINGVASARSGARSRTTADFSMVRWRVIAPRARPPFAGRM